MRRILAVSVLIINVAFVTAAKCDEKIDPDDTIEVWQKHMQNLAERTKFIVDANKNLPKMIDDYTRLDQITVNGNGFGYNFTFVSDPSLAAKIPMRGIRDLVSQQACRMPDLRKLLNGGFMITCIFYDVTQKYLGTVVIAKMDCEYTR